MSRKITCFVLFSFILLSNAVYSQNPYFQKLGKLKDKAVNKYKSIKADSSLTVDSVKQSLINKIKSKKQESFPVDDSLSKQPKVIHYCWEDGRIPEGSNAFTLHRHEFRLNTFGRSSYGITDRLEISAQIPLYFVLFPNFSLKYRFIDKEHFAAAAVLGGGGGAFPIAYGTWLVASHFAGGVGTAGFITSGTQFAKLDITWHPVKFLSLTGRGAICAAEISYEGLGALAGFGGAGVVPILIGGTTWGYSGGTEADFAINKRNAIIVRVNTIYFPKTYHALDYSIAWTHAWKHFHLTVGAFDGYGLLDKVILVETDSGSSPTNSNQNKVIPIPFVNLYWILHNQKNHYGNK